MEGAAAVVGVASVIDGDTIDIHGRRIRLYGIDAPEASQLCDLDGKPWRCGQASANALADNIGRPCQIGENGDPFLAVPQDACGIRATPGVAFRYPCALSNPHRLELVCW